MVRVGTLVRVAINRQNAPGGMDPSQFLPALTARLAASATVGVHGARWLAYADFHAQA
jgi:hypothetical protein